VQFQKCSYANLFGKTAKIQKEAGDCTDANASKESREAKKRSTSRKMEEPGYEKEKGVPAVTVSKKSSQAVTALHQKKKASEVSSTQKKGEEIYGRGERVL